MTLYSDAPPMFLEREEELRLPDGAVICDDRGMVFRKHGSTPSMFWIKDGQHSAFAFPKRPLVRIG